MDISVRSCRSVDELRRAFVISHYFGNEVDAERAELGHLEAPAEETTWLDLPPLKHDDSHRLRAALSCSRLAHRVPLP